MTAVVQSKINAKTQVPRLPDELWDMILGYFCLFARRSGAVLIGSVSKDDVAQVSVDLRRLRLVSRSMNRCVQDLGDRAIVHRAPRPGYYWVPEKHMLEMNYTVVCSQEFLQKRSSVLREKLKIMLLVVDREGHVDSVRRGEYVFEFTGCEWYFGLPNRNNFGVSKSDRAMLIGDCGFLTLGTFQREEHRAMLDHMLDLVLKAVFGHPLAGLQRVADGLVSESDLPDVDQDALWRGIVSYSASYHRKVRASAEILDAYPRAHFHRCALAGIEGYPRHLGGDLQRVRYERTFANYLPQPTVEELMELQPAYPPGSREYERNRRGNKSTRRSGRK